MKSKIIVLMVALALCASFAFADVDDAETNVGQSDKYDEGTEADSYVVEGGNVTEINLSGSATTESWQGFFGNTTANLRLGMGTDVLYDFGETDTTAVYATTNDAFNFSALEEGAAADVDSAWGLSGDDAATNVFNESVDHDGLSGTDAATMEDGNFQAYIADDGGSGKENFAFGAIVDNDGAEGFNGKTYNYEMMVPTEDSSEEYYFFMSI